MRRPFRNPAAFLIGFVAICAVGLLTACDGLGGGVKGELSEETVAQLTPKMDRYILLADISTWTKVAAKYSARKWCPQPAGARCAERRVVLALDETLSRLSPAVVALRVTAGEADLLTYIVLADALLVQLQAELASVLAQEAH